MTEIDFITAFGRLLRDGNLRDAFAADPQAAARQVQLRPSELPAWLQLAPADVEFQATVLLRKRLDLVKKFAPETCRRHGEKLWQIFQPYARLHWPPEGCAKIIDTFQFCQHLHQQAPETVSPAEWNRLNFALSNRRAALHWVELTQKSKRRRGFQVLFRGRNKHWQEFFLYFRL